MTAKGRKHTCWDRACTSHEDGYVGSPDAPPEGEFVQRHDGNSNVHIVREVVRHSDGWESVRVSCGGAWPTGVLRHANGDAPRQCNKCWEAM